MPGHAWQGGEQKQWQQEGSAGVDPHGSRSGSTASLVADPSPVKSVPNTPGKETVSTGETVPPPEFEEGMDATSTKVSREQEG